MYFLAECYHNARFWGNLVIPLLLFAGTLAPIWLNLDVQSVATVSHLSAHASLTCLAYYLLRHIRWLLSGDDDAQFWTRIMLSRLHPYRNWLTFYQAILKRHAHLQQIFLVVGNKSSGKTGLLKNCGAKPCSEALTLNQTIMSQQWWQIDSSYYLECNLVTHSNIKNQYHKNKLSHYFSHLMYGLGWKYQYPSFDGVIVTVSANTMYSHYDDTSTYLINIRNQINVLHNLSYKTPVYFVITHLDKLPGFDGFFQFLDIDDFDKILGFVLQDSSRASLEKKLAQFTHEIENYLLYALEKKPSYSATSDVKKLHQFQDAIYSVQDRIAKFIGSLPKTLDVRGCFYSSNADNLDSLVDCAQPMIQQQNTSISTIHQPCFVKHILKSIKKRSVLSPSFSFLCLVMFTGLLMSFVQYPGYINSFFSTTSILHTNVNNSPQDTIIHQFYYNQNIIWKNMHARMANPLHAHRLVLKAEDFTKIKMLQENYALDELRQQISVSLLRDSRNCDKDPSRCVNHLLSLLVLSGKIEPAEYFLPSQRFPDVDITLEQRKLVSSIDKSLLSSSLQEAYSALMAAISSLSDARLVDIFKLQHAPAVVARSDQQY